ncbi:hypothetical protein [Shewanella sp. YLB-07]|nr:hypothetical protein [Shewanella sp. YLB-07]
MWLTHEMDWDMKEILNSCVAEIAVQLNFGLIGQCTLYFTDVCCGG